MMEPAIRGKEEKERREEHPGKAGRGEKFLSPQEKKVNQKDQHPKNKQQKKGAQVRAHVWEWKN